jgi:hypothetical protein
MPDTGIFHPTSNMPFLVGDETISLSVILLSQNLVFGEISDTQTRKIFRSANKTDLKLT